MNDSKPLTLEELRIGNIIQYGKFQHTMDYSDFMHMAVNGMENVRGIPLTEQWLLDFGFEISKGSSGNKIYGYRQELDFLKDYGSQSFVLEFNEHSKSWGGYLEFGYYDNQIGCDYVHQLQNLYFALTQTELQLTAKKS